MEPDELLIWARALPSRITDGGSRSDERERSRRVLRRLLGLVLAMVAVALAVG